MANVDNVADDAIASGVTRDAGFWKRALALLIDVGVVGTIVSTLYLLLAAAEPNIGRIVTLSTPFGIGTVERTIDSRSTETTDADGGKVIKTDKIIERSVLDTWVYRYRIEETARETEGAVYTVTLRTNLSWQIDPATGQPIETVEVNEIVLAVLMLYWIFTDASLYRGGLGKRVLGLEVVNAQGQRLTLAAAAARNLLKILSAAIICVGFMMAGWTQRKQALHDKIVGTYVVTH